MFFISTDPIIMICISAMESETRALTEFIDTGIHILVDKSIKDTGEGIYILLHCIPLQRDCVRLSTRFRLYEKEYSHEKNISRNV